MGDATVREVLHVAGAAESVDVLYLTHNYPRNRGDFAGRFIARLAQQSSARGIRIGVLAPHHPGAELSEVMDGIGVRRFRYAPDARETLAYRGDLGKLQLIGDRSIAAHMRFFRCFAQTAAAEITRLKPGVIHAHWWIPAGWVARGLDFKGRLIVTLHGTDLRLLQRKRWLRPLAGRVFASAAVITVVSNWLAGFLRNAYPDIAGKIHVLPMPPDDQLFVRGPSRSSAGRPPVIVSVTRFTTQKRNDVLLKSLARLKGEGLAFKARLIGEGPLRAQLLAQIASTGLADSVELVEPMPQSQLAGEYQSADLVVITSVDEGFGMALLEAQLCGTLAVGVRSGGLTDIAEHGRTGLLARPDDPGDLALVLNEALRNDELRRTLAEAGHASAMERFSSSKIIDQFCRWYKGGS